MPQSFKVRVRWPINMSAMCGLVDTWIEHFYVDDCKISEVAVTGVWPLSLNDNSSRLVVTTSSQLAFVQ